MRFGWLSDTHLDTFQYGLERRREDFAIAFDTAVSDMLHNGIKVIVHSGDLLNSNRPSPRAVQWLQKINTDLIAASATMLLVSGNHDKTLPHWVQTLGNVTPFGIQLLDFQVKYFKGPNGETVSFYGVPFLSADYFRAHKFINADVLIMHQAVDAFAPDLGDTLKLEELPKGYRLIAMGDIHVTNIITQPGYPDRWVGYPGSTEMKSESEDGQKYWIDVEIDPLQLTMNKRSIATRPVLRVEITRPEDLEPTIAKVAALSEKDERKPIVFVRYAHNVPDVMLKFRTALNPDTYILRFTPVFVSDAKQLPDGTPVVEHDDMTVEDILRREMSTTPELVEIATQLINPSIDSSAALDEYIDRRLRTCGDLRTSAATAAP